MNELKGSTTFKIKIRKKNFIGEEEEELSMCTEVNFSAEILVIKKHLLPKKVKEGQVPGWLFEVTDTP